MCVWVWIFEQLTIWRKWHELLRLIIGLKGGDWLRWHLKIIWPGSGLNSCFKTRPSEPGKTCLMNTCLQCPLGRFFVSDHDQILDLKCRVVSVVEVFATLHIEMYDLLDPPLPKLGSKIQRKFPHFFGVVLYVHRVSDFWRIRSKVDVSLGLRGSIFGGCTPGVHRLKFFYAGLILSTES